MTTRDIDGRLERRGGRPLWVAMLAAAATALVPARGECQITPPPGYIYSPQLLAAPTQSCIAAGPGGTFVGVGPGFTANAQAVVFVKESGEARLVAFGFNSLNDCAYDAAHDRLFITDNADNADLGITTGGAGNTGAQTGDTVFMVPGASMATALPAPGLELLAPNSVEFAAGVAVDASGRVYVADAAGGGAGTVTRIDGLPGSPAPSLFASGFDFAGGIAVQPGTGDVFVADTLSSFEARIQRFDAAGNLLGVFAGPSFGFGSFDLAFDADGRLLATGLFGGDVVAFDDTGTPSAFVSGLTFATGVTVHPFTGRVDLLASFSGTDEDRTIHRFVPIARLAAGSGSPKTECLQEFYGIALVPPAPGKPARQALCTDGAPCDTDGEVNDRCLFPLGFCLNVPDPALPECSTSDPVTAVSMALRPDDRLLDGVRSRLASLLPLTAPACVFTDGVVVPVKTRTSPKKPGKAVAKVTVETAGGGRDRDRVKLVCQPA